MQWRLPFAILTLVLVPSLTRGQSSRDGQFPQYEVYGSYLYTGEFPYNVFRFPLSNGAVVVESDFGTRRGLATSFTRNFRRSFGLKGEFSAQFHHDEGTGNFIVPCGQTACTVSQPIELNPRLFNFLVGPEFKARNHTRVTPFFHALLGLAHTTSTFKTSGMTLNLSLHTTETGLSMTFGGGLDVRIQHRWSFRTVLDYNPKWVGRDDNGARQVQRDLRLSTGVLFHF